MPCVELQVFQPERDLPLNSTWLDRPHIARWWGESGKALSELRAHSAETIAIIGLDGRPVGLLCWQTPSLSDLSQAGLADLPSDLIDIDIMIGEADLQGQGVGPQALRLLFERLRAHGTTLVGVAAAIASRRALSAYAKVGLQQYRDFVELGEQYRYFIKHLSDAA